MTCRIKRCYVHVLALHLDQIFSLGFRVSSCRAADAILPPACRSLSPQTAGRTRPPTRPGKLSGFSDVSQRNLALRGEEGSERRRRLPLPWRTDDGRRPWPSQSSSPARLSSLVPSYRSSAVAPFLIPSVRPPASSPPPPRPSVRPSSPAAAAIAAPDNFSLSPSLVKSGRTDGPLVTSPTHPSATQGPSLSEFCVLC